MKKAGIITIHDIYNYGSIYQALATQRVVFEHGYDAELIDYQYPNERHHIKRPWWFKALGATLHEGNVFLKNCLPGRPHTHYEKRYREFKERHYRLSAKRYPTAESLQEDPPRYDIYVSGSDQLWRPKFVNDDPSFFLGFAPENSHRISYASSFGVAKLDSAYTSLYKRYLEKFSAISVREEAGARIVKELTGKDVPVVLDPTLLLNGKQWQRLASPAGIDEPYILCYGFNPGSRRMEEVAVEMGRKYGLKVVRANGKFHNYFDRKIHYVLDAGPAECLSLFANASFVMAQSFHATAFSINFRKPFYALLRGDSDHDSRQLNILTKLNLLDRVRYVKGLSADRCPVDTLDYTEVDAKLQHERQISMNYLKSALAVDKG